jgi:hypothetical protein
MSLAIIWEGAMQKTDVAMGFSLGNVVGIGVVSVCWRQGALISSWLSMRVTPAVALALASIA